jgi:hypothetical protein
VPLTRKLVNGEFALGLVTRTYEVRTYGPSKPASMERACTSLLTARGPMRSVVTVPDR